MALKNLGDLREWYANKAAGNDHPRPIRKQIFENMEFVRDLNQQCLAPDDKELIWEEGSGARIKERLVYLDFDSIEK